MTAAAITQDNMVERLAQRDPLALDYFYRHNRARILAWTRQYISDPFEAEEVLQDVIWTVHRKADTFRGESGFSTWLFRVTQNAARMHLRKKKRVPAPVEEGVVHDALHRSDSVAHPHQPDEIIDAQRTMARMRAGFAELSEENRQLYREIELLGTSKEEIAERMGISVPAAKARLHRVRVALKSAMACPA